jgi:membrane protease YdiL (CAAX protease family)
MLPETPWRMEALIRLLLGALVCVLAGGLMTCLLRLARAGMVAHPLAAWAVIGGGMVALGVALGLTRQPWQFETMRRRLTGLVVSLYTGLVLTGVAQRLVPAPAGAPGPDQMIIAGISFQGMTLVLVSLFLREQGLRWTTAFGWRERPWRAMGWGALAVGAVLPVAWLLQLGIVQLLTRLNLGADAQVAVQVLRDAPAWTDRLPLGIIAIVIAPPAEEAVFRGLIYPTIKRLGYPRLALWGTTLLFAAIHWNLASFLPLVLLALVLTWLYERTGNLLAPMVTHALFNAVNFMALQLVESH